MGKYLKKLNSLGGDSLSKELVEIDSNAFLEEYSQFHELIKLLKFKNGFYLFESALYIRPLRTFKNQIGFLEWNSKDLWVNDYQNMAKDCLFFAEDVFGCQFCIKSDGIYSFDPETGRLKCLAKDLEDWSQIILDEYNFYSGFEIAHDWQISKGILKPEIRLMPKTPFVLGGLYELDNFYPLNSIKAMKLRASLALQIKDLPNGAKVSFKIVD